MVWTFITKWEENKQTHHNTFAFIPRAFGDLFDVIWVLVSRNSVPKYPKSSFPSGESQNPAQPLSNPKKLLIMPTVNKKTSLWLDDLDRHESTWIFSELQMLPLPPPLPPKKTVNHLGHHGFLIINPTKFHKQSKSFTTKQKIHHITYQKKNTFWCILASHPRSQVWSIRCLGHNGSECDPLKIGRMWSPKRER